MYLFKFIIIKLFIFVLGCLGKYENLYVVCVKKEVGEFLLWNLKFGIIRYIVRV